MTTKQNNMSVHTETNNNYCSANFINSDDPYEQAEYIMENYVYCGYHTEGHDDRGADKILHYISKAALGNRELNTIGKWDYNLEVWPSDKYYRYLGH